EAASVTPPETPPDGSVCAIAGSATDAATITYNRNFRGSGMARPLFGAACFGQETPCSSGIPMGHDNIGHRSVKLPLIPERPERVISGRLRRWEGKSAFPESGHSSRHVNATGFRQERSSFRRFLAGQSHETLDANRLLWGSSATRPGFFKDKCATKNLRPSPSAAGHPLPCRICVDFRRRHLQARR